MSFTRIEEFYFENCSKTLKKLIFCYPKSTTISEAISYIFILPFSDSATWVWFKEAAVGHHAHSVRVFVLTKRDIERQAGLNTREHKQTIRSAREEPRQDPSAILLLEQYNSSIAQTWQSVRSDQPHWLKENVSN